ncbi:alpha/beta hydrolase family protein [Lignipirellula cremea]|uniref:Acetyl xylan esterase (AXE1) n=1 Tax=Lignipirellula cremea TaxID=2528010 RepID=A0A518DVS7_9BACT|nr:alpha/beta hydrolase family protein [Lignipirellula cremea]QDU95940.1 hypothetical protein Pla8534_37590 [Lignipirellula cremea]
MRRVLFLSLSLLGLLFAVSSAVVHAQSPQVLKPGEKLRDVRLEPLKDLNGYFPFEVSESPQDWEKRAEQVRRQLKVALGVWPMPTKTPLQKVIYGRIEKDGYTVEKAYFESFPGLLVTGNLYRPTTPGPHPGVLCPHGHWKDGRFYDVGANGVREQIEIGAEKFEEGGRSPLQARCVQLAKMGCVVFHYDMLGYADSQQLSYELVHRFGVQRPEMNTLKNWGLYSAQAEANLQSVLGIQAYNSVRALDFLLELKDVDADRLAVTGASGGGTQTFILGAIDPRPAVAWPSVMVSTAMQGGCTCENCSLLRVGTGNVEIAALFAPKPIGMTAADDWTKEMETKGFPDLKKHFAMMGQPDHTTLAALTQFKHNYNYPSRAAMYVWFNRFLDLKADDKLVEGDYERLTTEQMTVFDDQHPRPPAGDDFERKLLAWWKADADQQLEALRPRDAKSLRAYREVVGGGIDAILGRVLPDAANLTYDQPHKAERADHIEMAGLLTNTALKEQLPVLFLYPKQWDGQVVIWLSEQGKAGLHDEQGKPTAVIQKLLDQDIAVMGIDLFLQGEFLGGEKAPEQTRKVENKREAAGFTFGYNHSLFAQRTHDILTAIAFVRSHEHTPRQVDLVGLGPAMGPLAAAARAQARGAIDRAVIDTGGFRFSNLTDYRSPAFLPGGAKYDDLPGMLSLSAPDKLWLAGEGKKSPPVISASFQASGASDALTVYAGDQPTEAAVEYLLGK